MNTRKLLSGAAALALLCSAGGCGQNESEQTHAEVQQNSGTSDISTTDAPVSTEPAGTTGTSSVATTAVSTTSVPGTQPQFCMTTNPPVSTCEPQDNSHTEQAQTNPDPSANWQEALAAEIETWGGETFCNRLGSTTFRGTRYGFTKREVSETTYEYIFFSVDPDNRGSILNRWTKSRPDITTMYACNGRFYLKSNVPGKRYESWVDTVARVIDLYDTSGTLIQTCTLPHFNAWHDQVPGDGGELSSDFITVCGNGSILIRQYKTTDAYDRMHFYYLLDPETGEKTALPPPYEGAFGFFQCGNPVYPLEVDGVYQNKLYVTCTDDCKQKTGYWYDLNAGVWHALDVDLNVSDVNPSDSDNYAIGRFLFTKGRVYDMKTDQLLSGLPESAAPLDPNKLLDPNRTLTVNDTGVYLRQDDGSNTAILKWD